MIKCHRYYNGVQCKGVIPIEGDGKKGVCSLCGRPPLEDPRDRHAFYEQNRSEIIADLRAIGREETRKKWNIPYDSLCRLEKIWCRQGFITMKERRRWTKAAAIIRSTKQGPPEKVAPALSSGDRGRRKTPEELMYSHRQLTVPLGTGLMDIGGSQLEFTVSLKVDRQDLVHKLRQIIDE